MFSYAGYFIN